MEKTFRTLESSELYRKINALSLNATMRTEAIGALEATDRLASVVYWALGKRQPATSWIAPSTKLRHQ